MCCSLFLGGPGKTQSHLPPEITPQSSGLVRLGLGVSLLQYTQRFAPGPQSPRSPSPFSSSSQTNKMALAAKSLKSARPQAASRSGANHDNVATPRTTLAPSPLAEPALCDRSRACRRAAVVCKAQKVELGRVAAAAVAASALVAGVRLDGAKAPSGGTQQAPANSKQSRDHVDLDVQRFHAGVWRSEPGHTAIVQVCAWQRGSCSG